MIYFIQAGKDGPIKIGYSHSDNGVKSRLSALQTSNHSNLFLLKITKGNLDYEKRLHLMFDDSRLRGEWFSPTVDLLNFIEKGKKRVVLEIYRNTTFLGEEDVSMLTEKQINEMINVRKEYGLTCYVFS